MGSDMTERLSLSLGSQGFVGGCNRKDLTCQCKRHERREFDPWIVKIPVRRTWQLTPVLLSGELHGQRSLVYYCPKGHKESGHD